MLFVLKKVRDRNFGESLDPLGTKAYSFMTSEKLRIFRILATILKFDGNEKIVYLVFGSVLLRQKLVLFFK